MPSKEIKQAWLMVFAGLTGGIMGSWITSFNQGMTWEKWGLFFISLFGIVYLLKIAIKHNS